MKKTLVLVFALVFVVVMLAACGDDEANTPVNNNGTSAADGGTDADEGTDDDYGMVEEDEGYYQDFTFVNSTQVALVELRASAGNSEQWRNNMLEGITLEPDQYCTISVYIIPGDTTDLRVVAENGAEHELLGYELEGFSTLDLLLNDDGSAVIELS